MENKEKEAILAEENEMEMTSLDDGDLEDVAGGVRMRDIPGGKDPLGANSRATLPGRGKDPNVKR